MITISFSHLWSLTLALEQLCIYVSEKEDGWECKRSHKNTKKKRKRNYSYCKYVSSMKHPVRVYLPVNPYSSVCMMWWLYNVITSFSPCVYHSLFFSSSPNLTYQVNLFALVFPVCYPHRNRSEDLRLNTVGARMVTPVYIQP